MYRKEDELCRVKHSERDDWECIRIKGHSGQHYCQYGLALSAFVNW